MLTKEERQALEDEKDDDSLKSTRLGEALRNTPTKKEKFPKMIGKCEKGVIQPKSCSCKCEPDWGGVRCNECKHAPCKNGGVLNKGHPLISLFLSLALSLS